MIRVELVSSQIDIDPVIDEIYDRVDIILTTLYDYCYDFCPVRTGYMRSTIDTARKDDNCSIYVGASYAIYTEYRTGWFSSAISRALSAIDSIWTA